MTAVRFVDTNILALRVFVGFGVAVMGWGQVISRPRAWKLWGLVKP